MRTCFSDGFPKLANRWTSMPKLLNYFLMTPMACCLHSQQGSAQNCKHRSKIFRSNFCKVFDRDTLKAYFACIRLIVKHVNTYQINGPAN